MRDGKNLNKNRLGRFLLRNPFPRPLTQGFFYREKMRAIHRIAPDEPFSRILEIGGGQSGLTALLYPEATITNLDCNPAYARASCNLQERVRFVCDDAAAMPFEDCSFDLITMFDVLEHIPRDDQAMKEALRVLIPGGFLLISAPNEKWRFPYHAFMQRICPGEAEVMADWGHVRRGYALGDLEKLIGLPCRGHATFITPFTVFSHDVAFSHLPFLQREFICAALSPLTWSSYLLHKPEAVGVQTASSWQKPKSIDA